MKDSNKQRPEILPTELAALLALEVEDIKHQGGRLDGVAELIDHIDVYHAEKKDGITTQRLVIYYNCIGAFAVPDRKDIPDVDVQMETRKGVAVSYAPAKIA